MWFTLNYRRSVAIMTSPENDMETMKTKVIKAGTESEVVAAAKAGARALRAGKLVGFATETVYGIAALSTRPETIERLRRIKSRPTGPFSVHVASPQDVAMFVGEVPNQASRLMAKAWPGPVTILLPTGGKLADRKLQKAGLYDVLCSRDTIGLRCPRGLLCEKMLAAAGGPVVAPSANPAGKKSPRSADDVIRHLDGEIDILIDTGPTEFGKDSTIVSFKDGGWELVRAGVYCERTIKRLLKRKIVFVCTGNTCRSPMAAGLAKKNLAEQLECGVGELRNHGIDVVSAGIFASDGSKATPEAISAAKSLGADISRHHSRKLTSELINDADMVFCMTSFHVEAVRQMLPTAAGKVRTLASGSDIPDPIGGGAAVYGKTALKIQQALLSALKQD